MERLPHNKKKSTVYVVTAELVQSPLYAKSDYLPKEDRVIERKTFYLYTSCKRSWNHVAKAYFGYQNQGIRKRDRFKPKDAVARLKVPHTDLVIDIYHDTTLSFDEYNGWTNWVTWAFILNCTNVEHLYEMWMNPKVSLPNLIRAYRGHAHDLDALDHPNMPINWHEVILARQQDIDESKQYA